MKLLFLYGTANDRAVNYLYDGFVDLLGRKNVIEFPEQLAYVKEEVDTFVRHPHAGRYFNYRDEFFNEIDGGRRGWCKEQILEMAEANEFEAVFCAYGINVLRDDEFLTSEEKKFILSKIGKVGYLDWREHGSDPLNFTREMEALDKPYYYFKRECIHKTPPTYGNACIFPLPFCVIPQQNTDIRNDYAAEKRHDIYFCGGMETHSCRDEITRHLVAFSGNRYRVKIIDSGRDEDRLSRRQMLLDIADSYMGLSLPGAGMDTFRFWEILSTATCLVAHRTGLLIPNDYKDMHEIVYFSTEKELRLKITQLMKEKDRIAEIAHNGHEKTQKFHTSMKRAEYVAKIMNLECLP